ncbi:MAG TPA: AAA family ATPase [Actinomycetales bacterium]|jgi:chromosome partitioning protein
MTSTATRLGWPVERSGTVLGRGLGWPGTVSRETPMSQTTDVTTQGHTQVQASADKGQVIGVEIVVDPAAAVVPPVRVVDPPPAEVETVDVISADLDDTPLARELADDTRRRRTLHGQVLPAPPQTRVLTMANQKGGVGKTTTAVNMAAALAQSGLQVLVLDLDPQGNTSTALGIPHHAEVPSVYDVLVDGMPLADAIQPCPDVEALWCAPATIDLAGAEIELVPMVARETRLLRALQAYLRERSDAGLPRLDYVLIDCPPSLGLLTVNALVSAQEVFIPIQCEYYALEGLSQLLKNIDLVKRHLNPDLFVSTILLTMYDGRTRLSSEVADQVREHFPELVLRTTIPRSVRISEAPSHGQTVMSYDPGSSGALSYLEAARELAHRADGQGGPGRQGGQGHASAGGVPAAGAPMDQTPAVTARRKRTT